MIGVSLLLVHVGLAWDGMGWERAYDDGWMDGFWFASTHIAMME
jgi:hypothetical protein